ncbi:MAG: hypothetical protein KF824_05000 [Fimbriimonadaceae bacterium]|nr:MAG: hypothetical protein KF824_05000 [Fimbriimonadaceae bacterium]
MLSFVAAGLILGQDAPAVTALELLKKESVTVSGMVKSGFAKEFLAQTEKLKPVGTRVLYRNPDTSATLTESEYEKLSEEKRKGFEKREFGERFYYNTAYGSPTLYALPLDVAAKRGMATLKGKKVLDFGYGMIGQVQMMAHAGANAHGVDVEPLFEKLYSWPGDTGSVPGGGSVTVHHGQWPKDKAVRDAIGRDYDLFVTKNVLKMGYIHPKRKTDPRNLVDLGVSDGDFLKSVMGILKPGGLFVIYNLSPAQNPVDQPYLPHADGTFPFDRKLTERVGFEVLDWDVKDDEQGRGMFLALGYDFGEGMEELKKSLFTHYTVLRKPLK